ncbi:MAG: sigma-70 family RNA polymerase sigma factor [Planctomycetes bacterium]|nr:sigma-70 family RNA polymerase sigma factor [Planctomycetota bacterium]
MPALAAAMAPDHGLADSRSAQLVERFIAGDRGAFAELVAEHQGAALATAVRITGDADAAHDVVQEAFVRVVRHAARYERDRSFRAWLLAIVRNLAIDALRRRRVHASLDGRDRAAESSVSAGLEAQEVRARVALVLDDLPAKYRDLLVMRELEGRSAEGIASETGIDYGTTRWRLHTARNLFRDAWIRRFGAEET